SSALRGPFAHDRQRLAVNERDCEVGYPEKVRVRRNHAKTALQGGDGDQRVDVADDSRARRRSQRPPALRVTIEDGKGQRKRKHVAEQKPELSMALGEP